MLVVGGHIRTLVGCVGGGRAHTDTCGVCWWWEGTYGHLWGVLVVGGHIRTLVGCVGGWRAHMDTCGVCWWLESTYDHLWGVLVLIIIIDKNGCVLWNDR